MKKFVQFAVGLVVLVVFSMFQFTEAGIRPPKLQKPVVLSWETGEQYMYTYFCDTDGNTCYYVQVFGSFQRNRTTGEGSTESLWIIGLRTTGSFSNPNFSYSFVAKTPELGEVSFMESFGHGNRLNPDAARISILVNAMLDEGVAGDCSVAEDKVIYCTKVDPRSVFSDPAVSISASTSAPAAFVEMTHGGTVFQKKGAMQNLESHRVAGNAEIDDDSIALGFSVRNTFVYLYDRHARINTVGEVFPTTIDFPCLGEQCYGVKGIVSDETAASLVFGKKLGLPTAEDMKRLLNEGMQQMGIMPTP
ncbi:MAG: hypothetical protein AAB652_01570 [Patescibacteria group bacterium]